MQRELEDCCNLKEPFEQKNISETGVSVATWFLFHCEGSLLDNKVTLVVVGHSLYSHKLTYVTF